MATPAQDGRRFVWYDLMTTDTDGATRFYRDVMGWTAEPWPGGPPYTILKTAGRGVGGVTAMPPRVEAPPHWLGYVGVPDVDETARQARELGGLVHREPSDITEVGRFAVVSDPQGAVLAVFTAHGEQPVSEGPPGVGEFSWHELATTDLVAAWEFYSELFGWEKMDALDMGEMGTYQMFGIAGRMLGGIYPKSAGMPGPPAWLYYARVDDLDRALDRVRGGGGQVLTGPLEIPGGERIAIGSDPQGALFALHDLATL